MINKSALRQIRGSVADENVESVPPVQSAAHLFRRCAHVMTAKDVDSYHHRKGMRDRETDREREALYTMRCGG